MKSKIENPQVRYAADRFVTAGREDIADLTRAMKESGGGRIRICAHSAIDDRLHEMLIVHTSDVYVRPHKHVGKSESLHVIEGTADVVLFTETGAVADVVPVGDYASGRTFYYRLADPVYHTLIITSPVFVFHETTNGPFRPEDTIWAQWAPDAGDASGASAFMTTLNAAVAGRAGGNPR
ncbi:MAG: WbuC family cupin fold metalloprotein [Acidobacteriia bacterium]|nr:WbuC family cupin fold metalloprotein [Terriglobia bacterium]